MVSTTMSSRTAILWALVMIMTLCCTVRAAPEALSLTERAMQDLKQKDNIVAILELLQLYRKEFQQLQEDEDDPNRQESRAFPVPEAYQNLPIPMAVQTKFFRNHDTAARDETKRGSYQPPLCYFKICSMGRKRNPH
ncbi:uncharacterized protein LOC111875356 isoform X2 [Cryptotermes secundus]|uniref:uncharacterized protein LOC111875356 isoform X2 n=1 Tax=Cryptotermes secundus TaxID=105785 RepID=UPI000CD7BB38|nr:uncharacterized protein LOC111875356 isoform X2 [Cryptotermes secundus]